MLHRARFLTIFEGQESLHVKRDVTPTGVSQMEDLFKKSVRPFIHAATDPEHTSCELSTKDQSLHVASVAGFIHSFCFLFFFFFFLQNAHIAMWTAGVKKKKVPP